MNAGYRFGSLEPDQVHRAYTLLQAAIPDLTWEHWRDASSNVFDRRRFMTVTEAKGSVRGLCLARVISHPIAGAVLDIPIFVVISPLDESKIARDLFAILRLRAVEARCNYMRFWTLSSQSWQRLSDVSFIERWDHGLIYRLR